MCKLAVCKLHGNVKQGKDLEDNSHELEIAQLSHNLAKGLDILSKADAEQLNGTKEGVEPSPETEVKP